MHEFSLAENIVEIVIDSAKEEKSKNVKEIILDCGILAGVQVDALQFAFETLKSRSILKNTKLIINELPGKAKCQVCGEVYKLDTFYELCPACNSFKNDIIEGQELKIRSINLE